MITLNKLEASIQVKWSSRPMKGQYYTCQMISLHQSEASIQDQWDASIQITWSSRPINSQYPDQVIMITLDQSEASMFTECQPAHWTPKIGFIFRIWKVVFICCERGFNGNNQDICQTNFSFKILVHQSLTVSIEIIQDRHACLLLSWNRGVKNTFLEVS